MSKIITDKSKSKFEIELPKNVTSRINGLIDLVRFYNRLKIKSNTEIIIDFGKCRYFEANLSAVLGAILVSLAEQNNSIQVKKMNDALKNILEKNGFLKKFGISKSFDKYETTISYMEFEKDKGLNFKGYIRDNLLRKKDFPRLSELAEKKITESIFELFENAHTHGQCKKICTCGQYFPMDKRIDLTIVDLGQTIKANVNRHLTFHGKAELSGDEAISWAVVEGNTTKTGDNPGGLGLDVIREFVDLNKGKLQIVSADGYWEYKNFKHNSKVMEESFPGTIANLEFNLSDENFYRLKSEISLENIF